MSHVTHQLYHYQVVRGELQYLTVSCCFWSARHVAHMDKPYGWVTAHMWMIQCHTYKRTMSHIWISHVIYMNERVPWVMSHWAYEPCHCEFEHEWLQHLALSLSVICVPCHTWEIVNLNIRVSNVTHMHESWMSHVTHESCDTQVISLWIGTWNCLFLTTVCFSLPHTYTQGISGSMRQVTHMKESWHTCVWIMAHMRMSH